MDKRQRSIAITLGLAAVYVLAARLGLAFDPMAGFGTLVWPPTGISLAAILLLGNRAAPGILIGSLVANLLAGASLGVGAGIALGNTGEAVVGALLLRRIPSFSITLERVTSVVALIVLAGMLSTMISATAGVASLYVGGRVQSFEIRDIWRAWWVGNMVGALLIAPLILVWRSAPLARRDIHPLERLALVAALVFVCALTFFRHSAHLPPLATPFYQANLLVAVLFWAALRFGHRGGTAAVLSVSVAAITAATLRSGPFALPELNQGLMLLQTFMAILAATCLLFGATIAERRIANQEILRANLAAETANRAKSQFLAVMSHELRTPLNAISGFAELLKTGVYGALNEKQTDAVDRIEKNEKDLLSLINEVLGFVDAEKQRPLAERRDVRLADAFAAVEPLYAADIEGKHLVVERAFADPRLTVHADPHVLEQILASLLSNAVKYTGEGGTISLGAERDGDSARIWVRDSGIGIDKEQLQRVFEPFFQADSGTTRLYSGVGLGLTIARDLARRMDGEVTLASEAGKAR